MAQVIWTESALQDLIEVAEYIALDKVAAANKLIRKIFSSTDRLQKFPKSGRKVPEIQDSRYLEIIVNPCRIFYRIEKDKIYILFVMRSERKLRNYLLDERANESS